MFQKNILSLARSTGKLSSRLQQKLNKESRESAKQAALAKLDRVKKFGAEMKSAYRDGRDS